MGRHYLGLVIIVMAPGATLGVAGGWWLGRAVLGLYADLFRFPELTFRMSVPLVASGLLVSTLAAVGGALLAVRRAVKLPPAEAMRPPSPARYRRGLVERLGLGAVVGVNGLIVLREIERRPLRTVLSSVGIAGGVALIILGHFGLDSLNSYLEKTLRREQRQDLSVAFDKPMDSRVVGALARMPGVLTAEGIRAVPVRARFEHRTRDSALLGLPSEATLRRLVEHGDRIVPIPADGVVITKTLGEVLGIGLGQRIALDLREGERHTVFPVVVGFVDESVGLFVYARAAMVAELEKDLRRGVLGPAQAGPTADCLGRGPAAPLPSRHRRLRHARGRRAPPGHERLGHERLDRHFDQPVFLHHLRGRLQQRARRARDPEP